MSDLVQDKTPRPEYRPQCFRTLQKLLGRSDATVEWIEVAVRHLKHEHKLGGNHRADELAAEYKVRVNRVDFEHLSIRWACFQVLSVYPILENFLKEFRSQHPREVRERRSDEDLLSYTLDAFQVSKKDAGILEYEILDYYRQVRNHLMHTQHSPQSKTHATQHARINSMKRNSIYASLAAPNKLDAMAFDDFILFSRATKHVASTICEHTCPTAEDLVPLLEKDSELRAVLRATAEKESRVRAKLASWLQRRYSLKNSADSLSKTILELSPLAQRSEPSPPTAYPSGKGR